MKAVVAIGALLLAAGSAQAQTSTTCQWFGAQYVCNTTAPPAPIPPPPPIRYNPPPAMQLPDYGQLRSPSDVADSFQRGLENSQRVRERELHEQRMAEILAQAEATRAATPAQIIPQSEFVASLETRKEIGQLLKGGNCRQAIDLALDAGDIELASNTKAFCEGGQVVTP